MGYEEFPELAYDRFENLGMDKRREYVEKLTPMLVNVLHEQGPLPTPGLTYFVNKTYDLHLPEDQIRYVLRWKRYDFERFYPENPPGEHMIVGCYRTLAQQEADDQPRLPLTDNYERSYYQLLAYVKLIRENPEYANAPLNQLLKLGVI